MTCVHICDHRCKGESGHHSYPSPQPGECLCGQRLDDLPVYCPTHRCFDLTQDPLKHSPTPAPSKGPYKVEYCQQRGHWFIKDDRGREIAASYLEAHANDKRDIANLAHSSALASREVAELVKAAKALSIAWAFKSPLAWQPENNHELLDTLITALAPFAGGKP